MSTKWSAETLGKGNKPDFGELLKDESRIMLLRGKNIFGDFVYCYLKINYPNIKKLEAAIMGEGNFNLNDFGTVLAAGKGEPTAEVKAEISNAYPSIGQPEDVSGQGTAQTAAAPLEKKNWDEY
jgi:hypothetical protein